MSYTFGMPRPPLSFRLKPSDAAALGALLQGGVQPVRVVRRALALLALDRGESAPTVSALVRFSPQAVRNIAQRYRAGGLDGALSERPRPGAAEGLAPAEQQRIIAMVCADPPAGADSWTVRLITEQAVKRKVVGLIGGVSPRTQNPTPTAPRLKPSSSRTASAP